MEIQSTRVFDDMRTTNNRPPFQQGYNHLPSIPKDTYSFSNGMSANLSFDKERSRSGSVFSGEINGKDSALKLISPYGKTLLGEGMIGDKELSFCAEDNGHKISGMYGNKEFNLDIDYQEPNRVSRWVRKRLNKASIPEYFNVSGTIGGREFKINLPFADIPQNEDERDILSTILHINGYEANSYQNKIMKITYSNQVRERMELAKDRRHKSYDETYKPLLQQGLGTLVSMALPWVVSTVGLYLGAKFGLKSVSNVIRNIAGNNAAGA